MEIIGWITVSVLYVLGLIFLITEIGPMIHGQIDLWETRKQRTIESQEAKINFEKELEKLKAQARKEVYMKQHGLTTEEVSEPEASVTEEISPRVTLEHVTEDVVETPALEPEVELEIITEAEIPEVSDPVEDIAVDINEVFTLNDLEISENAETVETSAIPDEFALPQIVSESTAQQSSKREKTIFSKRGKGRRH